MHGMHARLPKNFVLEERLERFARVIELKPEHLAGRWAEACHAIGQDGCGRFAHVHVDLGCGKGAYVVHEASTHPDTLYVAIDGEPVCIAYTAQHVMEADLANVVVVPALGSAMPHIFGAGEVDAITLNFPTPFPRKKEAAKRLTIIERLADYRNVLVRGGTVTLNTDSLPFWRFSQTQFDLAGYEVLWSTTDARHDRPNDPTTEYEERLTAQGATVFALCATPGEDPGQVDQTASLSLVDYLPDDLESLDYVPHGMQGSVVNLRNRNRRDRARKRR